MKCKTITIGRHKGKKITITKKKAKRDFVIVKLEDGNEVEIHKQFIK